MADDRSASDGERERALRYILSAWEDGLDEGFDADSLANAALFAAFADLVSAYGEVAVAELAAGLPKRIQSGEFSFVRQTQ